MFKKLNNKLTSRAWAEKFNIRFIDYAGFPSSDYFNSVLISFEDFTTRASICSVQKPEGTTRRDAEKFKKQLNPNYND